MSFKREEREQIMQKLIEAIGALEDTGRFSASAFAREQGLSLQTVYRYLKQLQDEGRIEIERTGRMNEYKLYDRIECFQSDLEGVSEDKVWRDFVRPFLEDLPETAFQNCNYAFTEMFNNVIEHSEGTRAEALVRNNGYRVRIRIEDNGVGIFTKIADAMKLDEKRFAVLELAKGKFTTDPKSHTGEGIFFSSKAVDSFAIFSDGLMFIPMNLKYSDIDSVLTDDYAGNDKGTVVSFEILHNHKQTMKELFDKYTQEPEHYGFTKTFVPVRLLEYGDEQALFTSRSQAKRLLVRFERFQHIDLDFTGISEIGQGFADEIFRVFATAHPNTKLNATNCSEQVQNMINHVTRG